MRRSGKMNRRNYQKELERIISRCSQRRPSVLLHSCCGPCSSSVLEVLTQFFDVTILWYNPNLYPEEEYTRRLEALEELIEKMGLSGKVKLLIEPWRNEDYNSVSAGLEREPEGGARCEKCFQLRLRECAKTAKAYGFDYFCSTLTVSRHKNAELINTVGEAAAREFGVSWLPSDFKKRDGENRSVELSEQYGIYRQVYCGCVFSLNARMQPREKNTGKQEGTEDE